MANQVHVGDHALPGLVVLAIVALGGCKGADEASRGGTASPASSSTAPVGLGGGAVPSASSSAGHGGASEALSGVAMGGAAPAPSAAQTSGTWSFDADKTDAPPSGFAFGRTGNGKEGRWVVEAAADAPSKPNVLVQREADPTDYRFPIAVVDAASFEDVRLSVSCRPLSGKVDQACGLVFRFKDANNYYLTRANALEDDVRLYHVKNGNRVQFASWKGKVATNVWHTLAVEAKGDRFVVTFDGKPVLDAKDATFSDAGKVGVWTKADSVTQFDDLTATAP